MRQWKPLVLVVAFGLVSACGGGDDDDAATDSVVTEATDAAGTSAPLETTAVTDPPSTEPSTTEEPATETTDATSTDLDPDAPDFGRVVALAEEFLLADLLSLGIEPIASTATVETAGFQGLDDYDLSDVEVLPQTTLSLEYLATLQPDTIITLQFWVDQIGPDALNGMAEVIVVPDGLYGAERLTMMGEQLGRPEHAAAAVAEYDAALAEAQTQVPDDCEVSLAAIYAGPSVAAFVDGPWELPSSIMAAGCDLDPDTDDAEPDRNGRAWLSLEQLGMLDSDTLVLMQSDTVEGESASVAEIEANPIWQTLPAVVNDDVYVFDRLGYPGLHGQIRFLDEFGAAASGFYDDEED